MTGDMGMTYHAMFSLYIMTGLLALVISVSLFCKSIAEAKEWKRKFGERNWDYGLPTKQSSHAFALGGLGKSSWRREKSRERNMKTRKTVSLDRGRTEWENEKRLFALKLENSSIAWRMQPTLSVYRVVSYLAR